MMTVRSAFLFLIIACLLFSALQPTLLRAGDRPGQTSEAFKTGTPDTAPAPPPSPGSGFAPQPEPMPSPAPVITPDTGDSAPNEERISVPDEDLDRDLGAGSD